jgi:Zn-finger nucleic acid-binding protein
VSRLILSTVHGEVAYRQIVLRDNGQVLRLPLTAPVNDLLGQLRSTSQGDETDIFRWVLHRYVPLFGRLGEAVERDVQETFLNAAKKATKGTIAAELAPHLERLRFAPDGSVAEIPDLAALAAWSLLEAVRRQPLELRSCPICKGRWLARPDESKYCQRVAPGQVDKDCRTLAKEKRLAGDTAYRAYRREYKRLSEASRRGAIDVPTWIAWRNENGPSKWAPFDEWKARRKRRARKGKANA